VFAPTAFSQSLCCRLQPETPSKAVKHSARITLLKTIFTLGLKVQRIPAFYVDSRHGGDAKLVTSRAI
jgi:hypothetical protein